MELRPPRLRDPAAPKGLVDDSGLPRHSPVLGALGGDPGPAPELGTAHVAAEPVS